MSSSMEHGKVGLIAGWGRLPIIIAEALKASGREVVCCGIKGHADESLRDICNTFDSFGLTKMGQHMRYFQRNGVSEVTMAGKIFKTILLSKNHIWHNFPDWTCLRFFYPVYKSKDRKDDTLLSTVTDMIESFGFRYKAAVDFAPELLVAPGELTWKKPSSGQFKDIVFGWKLAKEMGRLDVGQSVAVKGRAVLAVEAVEGTDESIRRAGGLCSAGNFVVVKVAKPHQDMRFDVPTIGISTIETMHQSGGRVLAIEADKTIILDASQLLQRANELGISVIALTEEQISRKAAA